jgi:RNA polymerase sigma-70 factor (ECF subfamily)
MIDRLALNGKTLQAREGSHAGAVMNSSEDLIARARSGDAQAFGALFDRYAGPILGFLYNFVGNREAAEDLTQETFVRAYRNLHRFRNDAKFSTWLFGIARNVAREWLRSKVNQDRRTLHVTASEHEQTASSPVDELLSKELTTAMIAALRSLNEGQRLVFVLKILQQQSYQEIVEITGFSLAKVKTELHRARGEMRSLMRPYLEKR